MLVYSYLRFSDPKQAAGSSADRQAAYAARWAAEHGMQLDTALSLRDEGLSAYHQAHVTRGALGAFLAAVEQGRIVPGSVLVVEGLDRLSRAEPIQAQAQLAQIINAGITVVTASDGKAYSRESLRAQPMDLIYSLLVMIRAHEESATKASRVTAAIVRQCQAWQAGTWRGRVRQGRDPQWVTETADGWALIPERAEAVREAVRLYLGGHSGTSIARRLADAGMQVTNHAAPSATHLYKLLANPALVGVKRISAGAEAFELAGYYPALIDQAAWQDLRAAGSQRGRRAGASQLPHIITGLGITYCGYCGRAMSGQNLIGKIRDKSRPIPDGYRRLLCASAQYGAGRCLEPKSRSVAPVERALMTYCADALQLRALYPTDRAAGPRAELAAARARVADLDTQADRLMTAMLATAADGTPAMFARRAREIETERAAAAASVQQLEHDLAQLARGDSQGAEHRWAELRDGVLSLDVDARLQARQLIADTFERLVIWTAGQRPAETPPDQLDVLLVARGGRGRLLRINAAGECLSSEDAGGPPAA